MIADDFVGIARAWKIARKVDTGETLNCARCGDTGLVEVASAMPPSYSECPACSKTDDQQWYCC